MNRESSSPDSKQPLVIALFTGTPARTRKRSRHARHFDALGEASLRDLHQEIFISIQDRVTAKSREMEIEMRSYSCLN